MSKCTTYKERVKLKKTIAALEEHELREILKILDRNSEKYSTTNSGVFFNLKYTKDDTIREIIQFVKFARDNNILLNSYTYSIQPDLITMEERIKTTGSTVEIENFDLNILGAYN
tara:strand:+ start:8445 stop:8789 length:345 start_codon:yes stop_codon:yes gene_type:complete